MMTKVESEFAAKIAKYLLQIRAIRLNLSESFNWASGWKSPVYCDNRKALSFPNVRSFIVECLVKETHRQNLEYDTIAGVATGAIAWGVLVAQALDKPFVYVRAKAKGHGLGKLVEGEMMPNAKVWVIEDLISTGESSLQAVEALRAEGANVIALTSIMNYGFDIALKKMQQHQINCNSLLTFPTLLEVAILENYINSNEKESILKWMQSPETWA